ncbi:hypothetical protein P261_01701 [Lachnospiraceae bacterium TWA4]|nr:hypothetical protein P261_01701 [Lachnospiraceae bacterium TWA4]
MGIKVRIFIVLLAIGLIVYGVYSGDYLGVLRKATKICFECIGIG